VQGFQGAHLIFGDTFRAFEIVDVDLSLRRWRAGVAAAEDLLGGILLRLLDLPRIDGGEQGINFGLVQNVAQWRGLLAVDRIMPLSDSAGKFLYPCRECALYTEIGTAKAQRTQRRELMREGSFWRRYRCDLGAFAVKARAGRIGTYGSLSLLGIAWTDKPYSWS
jgi:hypothetical protein